jgi:hypothetical protein
VERFWPRRQLEFYSHLLNLPPHHGAGHSAFQLKWPDTFLLIHKLQSDRSRQLRCEWYEEQLFWNRAGINADVKVTHDGRNRDLEEMSLAYVLAKMRMEKRLIPDGSTWGERIVDPSTTTTIELQETTIFEFGDNITTIPDGQYYVRLHPAMQARKIYVQSDEGW